MVLSATQPLSLGLGHEESRPAAVTATDGFPLAVTAFDPVEEDRREVVIVAGATAVPQAYYARFAAFLAARGWTAVTFDYRGVGGSRPARLRGFPARMEDWGRRDLAGVLGWLRARYPGRPLHLVGHSFGGQALALTDASAGLASALLVGAQSSPLRHWSRGERLRFAPLLFGAAPLAGRALGYVPGWLGLREDLPAGVLLEWVRWLRSPGYLFDHVAGADARAAGLALPLRSYAFTDDAYAPVPAVDALLDRFAAAGVERRVLAPADLGAPAVGHFGFFRPAFRDSLWAEAAGWLARHGASSAGVAARSPGRPTRAVAPAA